MSASASPVERPTLPGIQQLLSDVHFDRLRHQPSLGQFVSSLRSDDDPFMPSRRVTAQPPHGEPFLTILPRPSSSRRRTSDSSSSPGHARPGPYAPPATSSTSESAPPPLTAGQIFGNQISHSSPPHIGNALLSTDLPTYIVPAEQLPPDDDRRHGCGICHRRFNRPSSLQIHMNSHTGAQPFECPFPGCTRRFSVNSNMRRHYRNHRDSAAAGHLPHGLTPSSFSAHPHHHHSPDPSQRAYHYRTPTASPSSSSHSSFTDTEDGSSSSSADARPEVRMRSHSHTYPPTTAGDRPVARPRACTVPGCNCDAAPSALRPAFQQRQQQHGAGSVPAPRQHR